MTSHKQALYSPAAFKTSVGFALSDAVLSNCDPLISGTIEYPRHTPERGRLNWAFKSGDVSKEFWISCFLPGQIYHFKNPFYGISVF